MLLEFSVTFTHEGAQFTVLVIGEGLIKPCAGVFSKIVCEDGVVNTGFLFGLKNRKDVMLALNDCAAFTVISVEVCAQFFYLKIGEDEEAGNGHAREGTDWIECLSEIEATGGSFRRTH